VKNTAFWVSLDREENCHVMSLHLLWKILSSEDYFINGKKYCLLGFAWWSVRNIVFWVFLDEMWRILHCGCHLIDSAFWVSLDWQCLLVVTLLTVPSGCHLVDRVFWVSLDWQCLLGVTWLTMPSGCHFIESALCLSIDSAFWLSLYWLKSTVFWMSCDWVCRMLCVWVSLNWLWKILPPGCHLINRSLWQSCLWQESQAWLIISLKVKWWWMARDRAIFNRVPTLLIYSKSLKYSSIIEGFFSKSWCKHFLGSCGYLSRCTHNLTYTHISAIICLVTHKFINNALASASDIYS